MIVVNRIVTDIAVSSIPEMVDFYQTLFDLKVAMDHGWVATLKSDVTTTEQITFATEGGSGAPVPDLSIDVNDVDVVHARAIALEAEIVYPLTDEPWGVRRFFLRDPAGKVVNVLTHL